MIDRLVHHAEILGLKGDSYRLRDKDLGRAPARLAYGFTGQALHYRQTDRQRPSHAVARLHLVLHWLTVGNHENAAGQQNHHQNKVWASPLNGERPDLR